jgi:helix-turn-helix protein
MTDIGATLREARMRARIDITEVEQATKIRAKYLRAMEDEEWGVLPGSAYVKGFLRTYGDYLGLDSRLLIEEFKRRYERPSEAEVPALAPPRGQDRRPRAAGRWVPAALAVLVLVGLLAGLYLLGRGGNESRNAATSPTTPSTTTAKRNKPHRRHKQRATAPPRRVRLQLVPTGAVYVCLVDGRGRKLVPGVTLQPGGAARTYTGRRLLINIGNNSIRLRVNGRTVAVPASPGPIGFEFTPGRRRPLPSGRRPTCV